MTDLRVTLGKRLKALRVEKGWSIRELADRSGLSQRYLISAEHGQANVSLLKLASITQAFDIALETVFMSAPKKALYQLIADQSDQVVSAVTPAIRELLDEHRGPLRISLLGVRGAGKSTVGRLLAQHLDIEFVELDSEIERRADLRLADIFAWHGESYYRRIEHETLKEVLSRSRPVVIATGGGIVTNSLSFDLLRAQSFTVWLDGSAEAHWARVVEQGDARPMLNHPHAMAELRALLSERAAAYEQADHRIETSKLTPEQIAEEIEALVN